MGKCACPGRGRQQAAIGGLYLTEDGDLKVLNCSVGSQRSGVFRRNQTLLIIQGKEGDFGKLERRRHRMRRGPDRKKRVFESVVTK